jgi:lipopolysaccharide biosynthesis glycosyltransferase
MQIPIVLAINDAYLKQAKVLIYSLYDNVQADNSYVIHILNYQLSATTRADLDAFYAQHNWPGSIVYLDMSLQQWQSIPFVGKWGKEASYRLFLPTLLPHLDAIIYLDADVLVLGDLQSYYQLDLENYAFASVAEDVLPFRKHYIFSQLAKLDANDSPYQDSWEYINSGVMLLNLAKLREIELERRALQLMGMLPKSGLWLEDFVPDHVNSEVMPDQDILFYLAYAYTAGILFVPTVYNYLPFLFDHHKAITLDNQNYHDFVAFLDRKAVSLPNDPLKPIIIHFAACHPWKILHIKGLYAEYYHAYAKKVGWNTQAKQHLYFFAKVKNYVQHRLALPNFKEQVMRVLKRV